MLEKKKPLKPSLLTFCRLFDTISFLLCTASAATFDRLFDKEIFSVVNHSSKWAGNINNPWPKKKIKGNANNAKVVVASKILTNIIYDRTFTGYDQKQNPLTF